MEQAQIFNQISDTMPVWYDIYNSRVFNPCCMDTKKISIASYEHASRCSRVLQMILV